VDEYGEYCASIRGSLALLVQGLVILSYAFDELNPALKTD